MKHNIHASIIWLSAIIAGLLIGCGEVNPLRSQLDGDASGQTEKLSGPARKIAAVAQRAVLTMTVKDAGLPAQGWVVVVERSVSGTSADEGWSATTNEQGLASVVIENDLNGPFRRVGISGYYQFRATDPVTGAMGRWGSIPLNTPTEALYLRVGGRARENVPVVMDDDGLSLTVRELAGVSSSELMTSDVADLTTLDLPRRNLVSIDGLEHFASLDTLILTENRVGNLSPLLELTTLRHLDLDHNEVERVFPLRRLRVLTFLDLAFNQVDDLSVLPRLRALKTLNLDANGIRDISPLRGMSLTSLRLVMNEVEDISDLASLTDLVSLDLSSNPVTDFTSLAGLIALEELVLEGCQIADVSVLGTLTGLTFLSLNSNEIDDISPLSGLTSLVHLDLRHNELTTLSALTGFQHLETLALIGNAVDDLSVLSTMPSLEVLALQQNQISDLSPLADLVHLEHVLLEDNAIGDLSALVENEGIGMGDIVDVRANPLSDVALTAQIPALEARGVVVDR